MPNTHYLNLLVYLNLWGGQGTKWAKWAKCLGARLLEPLLQNTAREIYPCAPPMLSGSPLPSASDPTEADVVDNMTLMRRTLQVIDNTIIADVKKRDILNRQENVVIGPCFGVSSQNGSKRGVVIPFDAKYGVITASRIPSIFGQLEVK